MVPGTRHADALQRCHFLLSTAAKRNFIPSTTGKSERNKRQGNYFRRHNTQALKRVGTVPEEGGEERLRRLDDVHEANGTSWTRINDKRGKGRGGGTGTPS